VVFDPRVLWLPGSLAGVVFFRAEAPSFDFVVDDVRGFRVLGESSGCTAVSPELDRCRVEVFAAAVWLREVVLPELLPVRPVVAPFFAVVPLEPAPGVDFLLREVGPLNTPGNVGLFASFPDSVSSILVVRLRLEGPPLFLVDKTSYSKGVIAVTLSPCLTEIKSFAADIRFPAGI
jgi:hypothetical protein